MFTSHQSPWNSQNHQSCKEIIYWPGINNDTTKIVNACEICLEHRNTKSRTYYTTWHTKHSMDKSSNGYFSPRKKTVLSHSQLHTTNFFNISQLPDKLSSTVVIYMKHLFSKYGIPKVVISDNGPEFTANTFKTFSKQLDFKQTISSPHIIPKAIDKSKGQFKQLRKTSKYWKVTVAPT